MTGTTTPKQYVDTSISKILDDYFNNGLSFRIMPEIVYREIVYLFVDKFESLGIILSKDTHKKRIADILNAFYILLEYIGEILIRQHIEQSEELLKSIIIRNIHLSLVRLVELDLIQLINTCGCVDCFRSYFYDKNREEVKININSNVFSLLNKNFIIAFLILCEFKEKNITERVSWYHTDTQIMVGLQGLEPRTNRL